MRRFLRPGGVALALVLLAGGPASTAVRAADPTPDLKIELVGLPLSNTQRELQVRVTNVSNNVWAQESTARIETVKPTAGNVVKDIFVENLDPGQSTTFKYTLDADCNGHEVKAEVSAGKNYAGEPESGQLLDNNKIQQQVCPAAAGPSAPVGSSGAEIDTNRPGLDPNLPEPLRRGPHTYIILSDAVSSAESRSSQGGGTCFVSDDSGPSYEVGWHQSKGNIVQADCGWVNRLAVNFDLSQLDQTPYKTPNWQAVLKYNEHPVRWKDSDGNDVQYSGCVERLGLATAPWVGGHNFSTQDPSTADLLFPNEAVLGHTPAGQEWYVTSYVRDMLSGARPRYGFVLRGGNDTPQGHDDMSCLSGLADIQLVVSYTVD